MSAGNWLDDFLLPIYSMQFVHFVILHVLYQLSYYLFSYTIFLLILQLNLNYKIKFVAYSSQGSHTGQLDFCN